jgi:hypothetical protein
MIIDLMIGAENTVWLRCADIDQQGFVVGEGSIGEDGIKQISR